MLVYICRRPLYELDLKDGVPTNCTIGDSNLSPWTAQFLTTEPPHQYYLNNVCFHQPTNELRAMGLDNKTHKRILKTLTN